MSRYDVTIIGGGSGGLTAARIAASLGASVLLVDKERLGGDCLYTGCVPSKSLIHVARVINQAKQAAQLGLNASSFEVDLGRVNAYIQGVIGRVHKNEEIYVKDVTVRFGNLRFKSPTELLLDGESVISRNTIIATGSRPAIPEIPGLEEVGYLTNASVFDLMHLPASLLVVGGGPIGVEMSQAFARLGTQVTLIQGPDRLLPKEDPDVSELLAEILRADGIEVVTG
ncbi:MAG TPA: FAD-dependent oxidoreductase, partial [Ktedonobacteraceae bacterium]|nr:FAD-dependent oxidoreductase [Ktedonobacteraceae bacterium]